VKSEVNALKLLSHPHITRLYQVIDTPSDIYLVMELAKGGDLFDKVVSEKSLSEPESKRLFYQLLQTMAYIHEQNLSHRDIKLENLLLDERGDLKISDFGLCATMQDGISLETACGSPDYAAPEIV
jgi:serine/threonine protein kinase